MAVEGVRKWPVGADVQPEGGAHFRVWAPDRQRVRVDICGDAHDLIREEGGYFARLLPWVRSGDDYAFRLDDEERLYPDPASRWQPDGPHGRSRILDPAFAWSDSDWPGASLRGQIAYEMHIGTFTPEGTWAAAAEKLPLLREVGVSLVEMMPVAEFPGAFGWGYDGVSLFAPSHLYGTPDDLRRFVDRAHGLGIAVILDVVYNHVGPDGNYLPAFARGYFSDKYANEWGEPINFDGPDAGPVREFFITNAAFWVDEFHFDGLRLDATQQIYDVSADNIIAAVTRAVREAARGRPTIVVGENEPQDAQLMRPAERGGHGLDGLWNDDFHHSAIVALTGRREAYYADYHGRPQELLSAVRHGFLLQGQRSKWQKKPRGAPALDIEPFRFVTFLQNHDQIANNGSGKRLHERTSPGRLRALTALLLLAPSTPMLFQGQEFASSAPFVYFADHHRELAEGVAAGRRDFLAQFPSLGEVEHAAPHDRASFARCVLDWRERERHTEAVALHRDLARLRRSDPTFAAQSRVDGAVLGEAAFAVRFFGEGGADRLLIVNLGIDLPVGALPEPLLAPPADSEWALAWSSEAQAYGGAGVRPLEAADNWHVPGEAAIVLAARRPAPQ